MLQLHYFPGNASLTPHMLLEELGVPYELKLVDRTQGAHKRPDYQRLNPNGLIPVLVEVCPEGELGVRRGRQALRVSRRCRADRQRGKSAAGQGATRGSWAAAERGRSPAPW